MEINDKKAKTINLNEGIEYIDIIPENLFIIIFKYDRRPFIFCGIYKRIFN